MNGISAQEIIDLQGIIDNLHKADQSTKEWSDSVDKLTTTFKKRLDEIGKSIAHIKQEMQGMSVSSPGAGQALSGYAGQAGSLSFQKTASENAVANYTAAQKQSAASVAELTARIRKLTEAIQAEEGTTAKATRAQRARINELKQLSIALIAVENHQNKARQSTDALDNTYKALSQDTARLKQELKNLPGAFNTTTGAINRHNEQAVKMARQIQNNEGALRKMDSQMGNWQRNVGNYGSAWSNLSGVLSRAMGVLAALQTVKGIGETILKDTIAMQRLDLVVQNTSTTQTNYLKNLQFLNQTADQYGLDIVALANGYKLLAGATEGTNFEGEQTNKIFLAGSQAAAKFNLSAEETEGIMRALGQMFSKGTVQSEELKGQLGERLPGAFRIAAESMGVTTAQLGKLLKDGKVTAEEMLPKLAEAMTKSFGSDAAKNIDTITGSWSKYRNELRRLFDSDGIQSAVSSFNNLLADTIKLLNANINQNGVVGILAQLRLLPGSSEIIRNSVSSQEKQDAKVRGNLAEREGIEGYFKKLSQAQRDLVISEKERQYALLIASTARTGIMSKEAVEALRLLNVYKDINTEINNPLKPVGGGDGGDPEKAERERLKALDQRRSTLDKEMELELAKNEKAFKEKSKNEFEFQQDKLKIIEKFLQKQLEIETRYAERLELEKRRIQAQGEYADFFLNAIKTPEALKKRGGGLEDLTKGSKVVDGKEADKFFKDRLDFQQKQVSDYLKLLDKMYEAERDKQEDAYRRQQKMYRGLLQIADETANGIQQIDRQYTDNRLMRLRDQYDYEIELVGDNDAAKRKMQKEYEKEERRIKREAAQREKAYALFKLGIEIALQIAAQNYIGAAIAGVQLAVAAATPIPAFGKGKHKGDAYTGPAIFGETGGEFLERNGKYQYADKATLTHVDSQTRIYNPRETADLLNDNERALDASRILHNIHHENTAADQMQERIFLQQQKAMTAAFQLSGLGNIASVIAKELSGAVSNLPIQGRDDHGYLEKEIKGVKSKVLNNRKVV